MNMGTQAQAFVDTDELPPDTSLLGGRIVLDLRIGRGGAATVYAATTADGQDVAVKIMSAAYAELPTARQRFRNEVMLAQHLAGHPHVVVPYEMGELPELDGRPYMTMPLVKGRSLLLRMGRMPLLEAVTLLRDLARILADVHERGIIHRDVKPGNVLVREQDGKQVPYLIDFGLAYSSGEGTAPVTAGLTAAHELPGTKHYMAPEQILGATPDPRFDVYALGVTMIEVLTGVLPLHDLSPAEAARRKCDPNLPSLSIVGKMPGLPGELEAAIGAALERDPGQRTSSAAMVAEQLDGVIERLRERRQPQAVPVVPEVPDRTLTQAIPPQEVAAGLYEHRARQRQQAAAEAARADVRPAAVRQVEPERVVAQRSSVEIPVVEAPPHAGERASKRWVSLAVAAAMVVVVGLGAAFVMGGGSGAEEDSTPAAAGIAASGAGVLDVGDGAEAADEPGDGAGADAVEPEDERLDVPKAAPTIEPEPAPAIEPEPAVEPEPTEVPEPAVEPEPEPPRKSAKPRKPKPSPEPSPAPVCDGQVEAANEANRSKQWSRVLELTQSPRCWPDASARIRLRIRALSELGRYAECAKLGSTSNVAAIKRVANHCAKQLGNEDGGPS